MKRLFAILLSSLILYGCGSSSNTTNNTTAPAVSVAISPSTQTTVDQGQTVAFTATVANDSSNDGVSWAMSGTSCSGSACGSFTSSSTTGATYNTPASVTAQLTVTVTATSVADTTKSASATVVVNPPLAITTTTLTAGTVGTAYSVTLASSGGSGTVTWAVSTGSLPAGLTLSGAKISGTPTANGTSTFTVKATDAASTPVSVTQQLSLAINNPALAITTTSLPNGVVGRAYNQSVAASGGTSPYTWSVPANTLPPGLSLNTSTGAITGSPTTAGPYTFTITVTDSTTPTAQSQQEQYTVNIAGVLSITTTSLPNGNVSAAYNETITTTGGATPLSFSATGSLPAGLTLSASTGVISGTPTTTGTSSFTVNVTDSSSPAQTATESLSITINAASGGALSITTTSLPNGAVGLSYNASVGVGGGAPPYIWSVPANSLPAGLSLNTSTGVISGTPTTAGASNFTVTVKDSATPTANSVQASLAITINTAQACTDTGSEALLTGQYAFTLAGFNSTGYAAVIGSFTADGSGHITGGEVDSNGALGSQTQISINTNASSYSVGSTHLGCLTISTSFGTFNTRIAVGTLSPSVATAGRIVEWDTPGSSTYFAATGQIAQQTASAFAAGISGNFAFKQFGNGNSGAVGALTASGGSITAGEVDMNSSGSTVHKTGLTGTYGSADSSGRFTITTTASGESATHQVAYIVSGTKFGLMPTDSGSAALAEFTQQSGPFTAASLSGSNVVMYMDGLSGSGEGVAMLGILSGDGVSNLSGSWAAFEGGAPATWSSGSCTYSVDSSGRMNPTGTSDLCGGFAYFIGPNQGYMLTGGNSTMVGNFDPQVVPSGGFSSALSGTFFMGDLDVVSWAESGDEQLGISVGTFTSSGGTMISDYTSSSTTMGQQADKSQSTGTTTINTNGTFNANTGGAPNGVVISSTKSVVVDNSGNTYPVLMIIQQ